ncbi:hypothetical protein [Parashewanella curva]|nr:hypothetical protein [Parashewanella curva]
MSAQFPSIQISGSLLGFRLERSISADDFTTMNGSEVFTPKSINNRWTTRAVNWLFGINMDDALTQFHALLHADDVEVSDKAMERLNKFYLKGSAAYIEKDMKSDEHGYNFYLVIGRTKYQISDSSPQTKAYSFHRLPEQEQCLRQIFCREHQAFDSQLKQRTYREMLELYTQNYDFDSTKKYTSHVTCDELEYLFYGIPDADKITDAVKTLNQNTNPWARYEIKCNTSAPHIYGVFFTGKDNKPKCIRTYDPSKKFVCNAQYVNTAYQNDWHDDISLELAKQEYTNLQRLLPNTIYQRTLKPMPTDGHKISELALASISATAGTLALGPVGLVLGAQLGDAAARRYNQKHGAQLVEQPAYFFKRV